MKKRRTLIISLLLIAALALGIGYAGYTIDLDIDGSAAVTTDPTDLQIEFVAYDAENAALTTDPTLAVGTLSDTNKLRAQIDANGFTEGGQSVVVTYRIANIGSYDANIAPEVVLPSHSESGE